MAERKGGQLTLILLDWEKELDKVDQQRMLQVLKRLGTPEHMLCMLENIYKQPNFAAQTVDGESQEDTYNSGISQGCPLSPYLFTVLMSALFGDITSRLHTDSETDRAN
jgi:hypothetical protein